MNPNDQPTSNLTSTQQHPSLPETLPLPPVEHAESRSVPVEPERPEAAETPEETEVSKTPHAKQAEDDPAQRARARGVDWVRPTDLIARGAGRISRAGIDFETGLAQRARAGLGTGAQHVAERTRHLPPLQAFGHGASHDGASRSAIGMT